MPRKPPGARAKGLGAELRAIRERTGKSQEIAAAPVGLNKSILSRIENGDRNISLEEVSGLLAVYEVVGDERERLLTMARTLDDPGWWEVGMTGITRESATLADYELIASEVTNWSPLTVPGLLQTLAYARGIMQLHRYPPAVIEARITARIRRQQTMWRPDVKYTAFIGEAALLDTVISPAVMHDQAKALLAAGERDNVEIRIVPIRVRAHLGKAGAFLLLRFPKLPDVVHVELLASGVFHDEPDLTAPYLEAVTQIEAVALGATESARIVSTIATELEGLDDQ